MDPDGRGLGGLLFGMRAPVSRRDYALVGFGLMALKYAVDATAVHVVTGETWTPLDYLVPMQELRGRKLAGAPAWLPFALALWTLPFLWVGASMTIRRALDAGLSGWVGLLFLVPLVNYATMLLLCGLPSRPEAPTALEPVGRRVDDRIRSALSAVVAALVLVVGMVLFTVHVTSYGYSLFMAVPFLLGTACAVIHNHPRPTSLRETLLVAAFAVVLAGCALLLFALEGVVCILMALPLAMPLALGGALVGWKLTARARARPTGIVLGVALLPLLAFIEGRSAAPVEFEVVTALEVDAPPSRVWADVVSFEELPPPRRWLFATGIAYPVRARIEGTGVGAVRHCEFSTGDFVEPITRWEEPGRLSFDVVAQPDPMEEWSFYDGLRPPHLERAFRTLRGEFRLVPLEGGRTRLEGSTWYALDIRPAWYWRGVSEPILHAIHRRVLEHVAARSER